MTRRTITLKSKRFREERQEVWKEMEQMLKRIESRSVRNLTDEEIIKLPRLYRSTLSSLSVARATSLDQSVVSYLESLSTRAYYVIYGNQQRLRDRIYNFFTRDFGRSGRHFDWPGSRLPRRYDPHGIFEIKSGASRHYPRRCDRYDVCRRSDRSLWTTTH